ncbi:MAG: hypothetical protein J5I98_16445 [Phaeodactylibacter sp.]|nr:hypothetical protein [Phaeodactylibacter sp.]
MRYSATLPLLAAAAVALLPLFQAHAQMPEISKAVAGNNEATFSISQLPNLDAIYDDSFLEEKPYPYWQAFWVYGDGNYYYQTGEMLSENSTLRAADPGTVYPEIYNYILQSNLEYAPIALMIDRKTDNPPPPAGRPMPLYDPGDPTSEPLRTTTDVGTHADLIDLSAVSPPLLDLDSPRRIRLAHSHYFIKQNRWSAFIIAYYPEVNGTVFFFNPSNFDSVLTFAPNYSSFGPTEMIGGDIASASVGYSSGINDNYAGATLFEFPNDLHNKAPLSVIDNPDDGNEELRLFHFLKSQGMEERDTFLAILAAKDALPGTIAPLADANFSQDSVFLVNIIDDSGTDLTLETPAGTFYYIDADTLLLASGEPKDPNELKVEKVIECTDEYFLVHFSLRFCNISPYSTESSSIFISSLAGDNIYCFQLPEDKPTGFAHQEKMSSCDAAAIGCSSPRFCADDAVQFDVKYNPIWKDRNTQGYDNCHTLYFTARANGEGLEALEAGGAVRACVNFRETACELVCSFNAPAVKGKGFDRTPGSEPCKACLKVTPPTPPVRWYWLVAIIVVVVGIIWFWRRGRISSSGGG